jgi:hypothetical protein
MQINISFKLLSDKDVVLNDILSLYNNNENCTIYIAMQH